MSISCAVNKIYTIGYSGFERDKFAEVIKANSISAVIDVRSNPFSVYYRDYDKPILEAFLRQTGIYYRNYAAEFGARQEDITLYTNEGWLDFEKVIKSANFREGMRKLQDGMKQGYSFVLMCAEKDPINCHRALMVSRAFNEEGYDVIHLMPDSNNFSQQELEARMLGMNDRQGNLFMDREELIREAYRDNNRRIGWRLSNNKEGE